MTVLTGPKWSFTHKKDAVTVTVSYSDTFPMSQGCHYNRLRISSVAVAVTPTYLGPELLDLLCELLAVLRVLPLGRLLALHHL